MMARSHFQSGVDRTVFLPVDTVSLSNRCPLVAGTDMCYVGTHMGSRQEHEKERKSYMTGKCISTLLVFGFLIAPPVWAAQGKGGGKGQSGSRLDGLGDVKIGSGLKEAIRAG